MSVKDREPERAQMGAERLHYHFMPGADTMNIFYIIGVVVVVVIVASYFGVHGLSL